MLDILTGNNEFAQMIRGYVSELTSGWLGNKATQKRTFETDEQHRDRLTKALAAGITEFNHVAKTINGTQTNDFNKSLKAGATYYTIKQYLIQGLTLLIIPVSLFLIFKNQKTKK